MLEDVSNCMQEFFEDLYLDLYPKLFNYVKYYYHYNNDSAEEVVQETFCIAWNKIAYLMTLENPAGWIFNTLKNVVRNETRKQERKEKALYLLISNCSADDFVFYDQSDIDLIYHDLSKTPEFLLLQKFVLEQTSVKELSSMLGISEAACRKRIQRAKEFVRITLKSG